jgi:formylglycine-generating enzyme required for sulfatase activity
MLRFNRASFLVPVSFVLCLLAGCTTGQALSTPTGTAPLTSTVPAPTSTPTATPLAAGDSRTDAKAIRQVWVPAGSFLMGTSEQAAQALVGPDIPAWVKKEFPSEQPEHEVHLTHGYWIDQYEVTNAAFQAFIDAGGYATREHWSDDGWAWLSKQPSRSGCLYQKSKDKADYPCVRITWYEAEAYAKWRGGRLPTEAEWEYAARGPQSLVYPWGNTFDPANANVVDSQELKPVGSYPAGKSWVNAFDMAGNAMEWVQDWLSTTYYQQGVRDDPPGPATGTIKIEKGGWWGSNPYVARSAYRHYEDPPDYADHHIGFRIVSPQS